MKRIVERRYGFGAARIAVRGSPLRRRSTPSLRDGFATAMREEGDGIRTGLWRSLTRGAAPTLAAIFVSIVLGAYLREQPDASATQIVPFEEPAPVAMQEPEPEPEPEPVVEPEPEPEPEQVAVVTPEPPPAVVPPPPKPEPPKQTPKPEPPRRTPPPPRIDPAPAPVIARAPEPTPPPRPTRAAPPKPARSAPPLAFAAAPLPSEREEAPEAPSRRPTFQTAQRPSDARLRPALDALDAPQDDNSSPTVTARSTRVTNAPAPSNRRAAPLDFAAAAPAPATPGDSRRESPTRRPVAATPPRRRDRGNPASLGMPAAPDRDSDPPRETASAPRSARPVAPAAPAGSGRRDEPGLRGVALASLDACRSDRDEDALKQRVVAAARDRDRCESAAGRFYFVETKNLNAFLMRIERAPGRRLGDRCSELLHALDCLAKSR